MARTVIIGMALVCVLLGRPVVGAEPAAPLTIRGDARPSFQITPLVQRFSARPGQRLKFSFDVRTLEKSQSLRIRAVSLKQQLNGLVVADDSALPPAAMVLSGPLQLDLKPEQTATIRGYVDLPRSAEPFHVYGILVTDLGRPLQGGQPADGNKAAIAVKFVTQYLLRVEAESKGGRSESAKELSVEAARLVDRGGEPMVEADVVNPTATSVEFQLNCRLLNTDGTQCIRSFGLALPARASRPEPQRYESLVFKEGRVRLTAPITEALFPGDYQLELEWVSRGRKCGKTISTVSVEEGDFPAQASKFAQIAGVLCVTPPQVELSQGRGGTRRFPLTLSNHGSRPLQIRLTAKESDGADADWVLLQPNDFLLAAKRSRNLLVTAQPGTDTPSHRYGRLRVEVSDGEAVIGTQDLPLALLAATSAEANVATGTLRCDQNSVRPAFALPVHNRGSIHVPLNGRLTLINASEQSVELAGGFGRWLLPGEQSEIRFPLHARLEPGIYSIKGELRTGESEQLTISQQVEIR